MWAIQDALMQPKKENARATRKSRSSSSVYLSLPVIQFRTRVVSYVLSTTPLLFIYLKIIERDLWYAIARVGK